MRYLLDIKMTRSLKRIEEKKTKKKPKKAHTKIYEWNGFVYRVEENPVKIVVFRMGLAIILLLNIFVLFCFFLFKRKILLNC